MKEAQSLDRPHAVPREEMAGKRSDDPSVDCRRVIIREAIWLIGQEDDVGLQRQNFCEIDRRVAPAIAQHVAPSDTLNEIRDVRVAAAPFPWLLPDWYGERERSCRLSVVGDLRIQLRG